MQAEIAFDRIDYLDTMRQNDRELKWYQSVLEQLVPVTRNYNYADLERVRAQSHWDELNECWLVPKLAVERRIRLPPATGRPASAVPPHPGSAISVSSQIELDLRAEERLVERLSESASRDPAAAYFRRASGPAASRRSANATRRPAAASATAPLSPLSPLSPLPPLRRL